MWVIYSVRTKAYLSLFLNVCYLEKVKIQDTKIEQFKSPAFLGIIK